MIPGIWPTRLETTLIGRPLERRYFQSFEAAVDYLAT
jgi:hypothetical protein